MAVPGHSSMVSIPNPAASVWSALHDSHSPVPVCTTIENCNADIDIRRFSCFD